MSLRSGESKQIQEMGFWSRKQGVESKNSVATPGGRGGARETGVVLESFQDKWAICKGSREQSISFELSAF